MEVVYRLPTKPEANLPIQPNASSISIDNAKVSWEANPEGNLNTVVLRISGQPLRFDDRGVILSTYPELESLAYRLSAYIANWLLIQTGFDAIDPEVILLGTPELHAETPDEENMLVNHLRTVGRSCRTTWNVRGNFKPDEYPALFSHSAAVALYADGLRVTGPFQKYELFYKVIEYFFAEDGAALDTAVSRQVLPHDMRFTEHQVEALRHLRNRCIHPRARRGHVNPENLDAVKQVQANVNLVQDLARLLLQYPTF